MHLRVRRYLPPTMTWALLLICLGAACETATPTAVPGTSTSGTNAGGAAGAASGSTSGTNTTASGLEQLSLERINRARLRPGAEASRNGIAIDEGIPGQLNATPKQPLALNSLLNQSARGHSSDMLARDYFAHNSPEGVTPFVRMNNAGYLFVTAGENLAWRGNTASIDQVQATEQEHVDLFVDTSVPNRGHRISMLNPDFREVGISIQRGNFINNGQGYDSIIQTQDFGTATGTGTFILGALYNDNNSSGEYDFGEGVGGATIVLNGVSKTTNSAGGYAFELKQPGTFTIRFPGNRTHTFSVGAGAKNQKIDVVNNTTIVVNLGLGQLN